MNGKNGYAVFFFPQALEALGEAIKPYLQDGPAGQHVLCSGVDTGGSLIELSLDGTARDGNAVELELMVPSGMVRMIVSAHSDEMFGFGPHALKGAVQKVMAAEGKAAEIVDAGISADEAVATETGADALAASGTPDTRAAAMPATATQKA